MRWRRLPFLAAIAGTVVSWVALRLPRRRAQGNATLEPSASLPTDLASGGSLITPTQLEDMRDWFALPDRLPPHEMPPEPGHVRRWHQRGEGL